MNKNEKARLTNIYLTKLFPEPKCELNFAQPYELLFAVIMSAQTMETLGKWAVNDGDLKKWLIPRLRTSLKIHYQIY